MTNLLTGYGRDGAASGHYVASIHPPTAVCGKPLDRIPLHQMPPAHICWDCLRPDPDLPPALPVTALTDDDAPTGVCPGCGEPQPLDEKGRIQVHEVERVRSGLGPCDGTGQTPEVPR